MNRLLHAVQHCAFVVFSYFLAVALFAPTEIATMTNSGKPVSGNVLLFLVDGNFGLYFYTVLIGLIASGAVYMGLLIYLTAWEGITVDRNTHEKTLKMRITDELPMEIRILILLVILLPYYLVLVSGHFRPFMKYLMNGETTEFVWLILLSALVTSLIFSFFYYGFVRRIRGKLLWKTSFSARLFGWIGKCGSDIYRNAGAFGKAVWPFALTVGTAFILFILLKIINAPWKFVIAEVFAVLFVGSSIAVYFSYREHKERKGILDVMERISHGDVRAKVNEKQLHGDNGKMAEAVNAVGSSVKAAVETSMKDEKMKADLITNVSHDLKTPLTSIISYVDLLKNEELHNEKASSYIAVIDEKSQRLKQMTEDLVEISKISSGNIVLQHMSLNVRELLNQAVGEFFERFSEKSLQVVADMPEETLLIAGDPGSMFRVIENLFMNIYKYAMEGTRVYLDALTEKSGTDPLDNEYVLIRLRNISASPLGMSAEELSERFTRGEESRTSEGSGLGLSIAKSLIEAMGGSFRIILDGDLFKVEMRFLREKEESNH
ncbi:MAG: HAMP domain-containing histidine kinase [Lachnospiraceae bacterium]|nr:HAMP domain-containing histidine kinase [Lachnospiraceae bacterium]